MPALGGVNSTTSIATSAELAAASGQPGGTDVAVADGGTGSSTAAGARTNLGISAANTPFTPAGTIAATDVQAAIEELAAEAGGAPTTVNYLVGTADAGLSAEIVVGTSPGGELGGTWASPTVDATHSGSTHAATQSAAEATAAGALASHEADSTSIHGITNTASLYVAGGTDVAVADGGTGASTAAAAKANLAIDVHTLNFVIDGGGATITTGVKGDLALDYAGTITAWTALADQSGSIVVDIWRDSYANFPPTVADTITGAEKPTITTATKGQDTSLASGAGWAFSAGDVLRFSVDSITSCQRVTISLKVVR